MRRILMKSNGEGSGMKKIFLCLILILSFSSSLTPVLSVGITSCSSGDIDGVCEIGKECTCSISGECTNGNLLLSRQPGLADPICSPQIVGDSVTINWNYCEFTEGLLYAKADCDEGQSSEKTIMVSQVVVEPKETTTSTTTVFTTTVTPEITHECNDGKGYCEDMMAYYEDANAKCPIGYYYCPEHNPDCPEYDEICCCQGKEPGGFWPDFGDVNFRVIIFIILAVVVGVVIFLFFVTQTKKGMSFEKLRKKWSK